MFDFASRRQRLSERLEQEGIDALFLPPCADLEYLTGVERQTPRSTPRLTADNHFHKLTAARTGAPPVRGKGVSSHPSGSIANSNLLPA